jgi:hypothetical protein
MVTNYVKQGSRKEFIVFIVWWDSPLGTAAIIGLLYQPQMIDDGDCLAIGGIKIGRVNRNTRRRPASAPLCPQQIPHDLTRFRTRVSAVEKQRLAVSAIIRSWNEFFLVYFKVQVQVAICLATGPQPLPNWQGNGPIRHIETCPESFFFYCKSTHNKIHYQNSSC